VPEVFGHFFQPGTKNLVFGKKGHVGLGHLFEAIYKNCFFWFFFHFENERVELLVPLFVDNLFGDRRPELGIQVSFLESFRPTQKLFGDLAGEVDVVDNVPVGSLFGMAPAFADGADPFGGKIKDIAQISKTLDAHLREAQSIARARKSGIIKSPRRSTSFSWGVGVSKKIVIKF